MGIYSSEELMTAIGGALRAHDMPAVLGLVKRLAIVDPAKADLIHQALLIAAEDASDHIAGSTASLAKRKD